MEGFKDLPALFSFLLPKGSLPENPSDNLPGKLEVCLPKFQEPAFTPYLTCIPQDCKLPQRVITASYLLDIL